MGLVADVLDQSVELKRDVIFLPNASANLLSITYLTTDKKIATRFEDAILALAQKHILESPDEDDQGYFGAIQRRGQDLMRASFAPRSPRGPSG